MKLTPYSHIDELLKLLLSQLQNSLAEKLVGLYLYGSLVSGDFDEQSSDIDLLAATTTKVDAPTFAILQAIHADFAHQHPQWDDRLEIAYVSVQALRTFKTHTSQIAVISPGEPFHYKMAGIDWLINWYVVQEKGMTLFGPAPQTLIAPIERAEFIHSVQAYAQNWGERIYDSRKRKEQAYAILTLCRALYLCQHGEQVSKKQAALWAAEQFPEWAALIQQALSWRATWRDDVVDHAATFPETLRFVQFAVAQVRRDSALSSA